MIINDLEYLEVAESRSPLGGSSAPYTLDLYLDGFSIHLNLGTVVKKSNNKPAHKPTKKNKYKVVKKVSYKKGAKAVAVGAGKGAKAYAKTY